MVNQVGGGRGNQIWAVGAVCAWRSQVGGVGMSEPAGLAASLLARCCICNPVFVLKLIIRCF
jgi:hypothetical protein